MTIKYLKKLTPNQFYDQIVNKVAILLHHTAGDSAIGAIDWWNQTPDRVGTALLVERDGQVYQCFEINRWAYHLGTPIKNKGLDINSVGIEIVSWGWLKKEEDKFYAYPLWPLKTRKVLIPKDQVLELDFKGEKYWHKYTDAQVENIVKLCRYLVDRFKIPVQNLDKFWEYDLSVAEKVKPGIWSHTTVRKDKTDIFPQPNLIEALKKEFNKK